uniref:PID domain-containing protein n=1 Tax=Macrostomum lignano TaxID=282301 RepID=A0A1I8HZM8_9PLAT
VDDFKICGVGGINGGSGGESSSTVSSPSTASAGAAASPTSTAAAAASGAADDPNGGSELLCESLEFRVRYLGWRYLDPDDVARAERSSGAVNRCIMALAAAEAAGDLPARLLLSRHNLRLLATDSVAIDNETESEQQRDQLIPAQPLLAIRLWGVGRRSGGGGSGADSSLDSSSSTGSASAAAAGRHFAYVARDDVNKYVCHVLDCLDPDDVGDPASGTAAVRIANAVCQRCRRLMSLRRRRQQQQQQQRRQDLRLPVDTDALLSASPFPSPQEEPSKCIPCLYLGCLPVDGPGGLDRLNDAINTAVAEVADGSRQATPVNARVSPSSLRFEPATNAGSSTACGAVELRVRYLPRSARFECHVCRCEPSCGPLCRTVEAACNLRYQKCLDSLAATPGRGNRQLLQQSGDESTAAGGGVKSDIVQAVTSLFSGLRRLSIK